MLPQVTLQNSLEFYEIKKKGLHSSDPQFSRNFLGHLEKKKGLHLVSLLTFRYFHILQKIH